MTSKEDDTLPLPAFSQELSVDVTADEDIIPTTQQLDGSIKTSKSSEKVSSKSTEDLNVNSTINSTIDDTLPCEALQRTFDKDKSSDFIPDTEAKKIRLIYPREELSCKKKLPVFPDISHPQSNPLWETPQVPESPSLDSYQFSILSDSQKDTQKDMQPSQTSQPNAGSASDQTSTQIIVNDSAETLELEGSPLKKIKAESETEEGGKLKFPCSARSDVGRCEETEMLDNSSVLLLEQQEGQSLVGQSEKSMNGTMSEDIYLMKTIEDREAEMPMNVTVSECTLPVVGETPEKFDVKEESAGWSEGLRNGVGVGEEELGGALRDQNLVIRKLEFKLVVSCFVTFEPKTKKVVKKFVSEVHRSPSRESNKPKSSLVEQLLSDNTTDKRYSTSSSGSVYSDKLPFVLSKRVSVMSETTDSSEDWAVRLKQEREAVNRVPWGSEYLIPMKLDELVQMSIENQDFMERPSLRPKRAHTKENHFERTAESTSLGRNSSVGLVEGLEVVGVEEGRLETPEADSVPGEEGDEEEKKEKGKGGEVGGDVGGSGKEGERRGGGIGDVEGSEEGEGGSGEVEGARGEEKRSSVALCEGVSVFARWTDKRYYPGVLCGSEKNDRWEVKFDDGTSKTIREDFILPTEWIDKGALVFALVGDKYVSGQITEIKRGKEIAYTVELDIEKQNVCTKVSDLCLTDVMAGIIREKYKPLKGTPRKKAEIDFDNVVSGKRLREQRTPVEAIMGAGGGSSGTKRKGLSKGKREVLEAVKESPGANGSEKRAGGLRSENGHLTEDKVVSADSPSGNEVVDETPVRRTSKEIKGKTKPRVLSYETEDIRATRSRSKSWLTADGTPIPGPSGCKLKRPTKGEQARKRAEERPRKEAKSSGRSPAAPAAAEKSKKRRKLEESVDNSVEKSLREENVRAKRKSRKG